MFKKILIGTMAIFSCTLSLTAFAMTLTIDNKTDFDSTTRANGGLCSSSVLGDAGITHPGHVNVITKNQLNLACMFNKKDCTADVYMSDNCSGDIVATVTMDVTDAGIKTVTIKNPNFIFDYSAFAITLKPAGSFAKK